MTRALATGPHTAALRRNLGPVAWCALECLLERSNCSRTTTASVRAVAADLGVAKNTAHRAMTVLARVGLIDPVQDRSSDGRFQPGRYVLHLAEVLDVAPAPAASRARRGITSTSSISQLSLLAGA